MARQKAAPLRREPSDFNQGPPESPNHGWKPMNGGMISKNAGTMSGQLKQSITSALPDQPGLTQLVICVGGIYASLYVPLSYSPFKFDTYSTVFPGLFSRNVSRPLPTGPRETLSALPTQSSSIPYNLHLLH